MSGVSRKTSISIKGLDEFRKTLEELGGDFKKAIKAGARKAGNEIAKEANAEAKSRGWSEDKYYDVKERKSSKGSDTSVAIKVGTLEVRGGGVPQKNKIKWYKEKGDRYYVRFPEYGTIYQPPQPLLIPIFENKKPVIEEYIKQKLQQAIDKANKKK
ncbi:HK97-gp10 family putative phage morphogenesis protein [Brachyspira sp. G79]|uniref:HK97-gp10 family putative phage morphogenesis protein n=1 Tax=Brachyspira sp. G79 TaxID=1358104 RepID=UPI000BBC58E6|nr:HK97-gp10 family putative phage morphogenesis protein [Brachyspira sp. G79]PCG20852.1 bacteriophage-like family protein [Brachyspira sp. G79]